MATNFAGRVPLAAAAWPRLAHLRRWRDPILIALFFLLTIQLRRPHKMLLPYAWDSLLFLRALDHFNATIHQPQPPGYLFYVSVARLLRLGTGDPQRALVWVSILGSAVAIAGLYLLARTLYDWRAGVLAAAFLLTSTTFWFYGEISYPYTVLAAGSVVLAIVAVALRRGLLPGGSGVALAFGSFGLVGGFRQDLLLFLAPLFALALLSRPARQWPLAILAGAGGVLAWLLPTAALSEGLGTYLAATLGQGGAASEGSSPLTGGLGALALNGRETAIFLRGGLGLALAPLMYFALRQPFRARAGRPDRALGIVALWAAPPLAFYLLAHIGDYGYTFSVLPALLVLAARGATLAGEDLAAGLGALAARFPARSGWLRGSVAGAALPLLLGAAVALGNGDRFLNRAAQFSVAGIACFDATMRERICLTKDHFPPGETLIFAAGYYQHVRQYLPQYDPWLYAPDDPGSATRIAPPGARRLLIFDETARPARSERGFRHYTLPCNGRPFYYTTIRPGDRIRYEPGSATIVIDRAGP